MVFESSRYLQTNQVTRLDRDSVDLLTLRRRMTFNSETSELYQVIEGDTLDGLAIRFYGDGTLRWVILDANPEFRTEFDIEVGDYLEIPDSEEVFDMLDRYNGGEEEED